MVVPPYSTTMELVSARPFLRFSLVGDGNGDGDVSGGCTGEKGKSDGKKK